MKMFKYAGAVAALALTAGLATAANATLYNLTDPGTQSGLSGTFGTVNVVQTNNVPLNPLK